MKPNPSISKHGPSPCGKRGSRICWRPWPCSPWCAAPRCPKARYWGSREPSSPGYCSLPSSATHYRTPQWLSCMRARGTTRKTRAEAGWGSGSCGGPAGKTSEPGTASASTLPPHSCCSRSPSWVPQRPCPCLAPPPAGYGPSPHTSPTKPLPPFPPIPLLAPILLPFPYPIPPPYYSPCPSPPPLDPPSNPSYPRGPKDDPQAFGDGLFLSFE